MENWKTKSLEFQQEMYERLGDRMWDVYKNDQYYLLVKKLAISMFGAPSDIDGSFLDALSSTARAQVLTVKERVLEICGDDDQLYCGIFYVFVGLKTLNGSLTREKKAILVIRKGSTCWYISRIGSVMKVHENWSDCMHSNAEKQSLICYPTHLSYDGPPHEFTVSYHYNETGKLYQQVAGNLFLSHSCILSQLQKNNLQQMTPSWNA